MNEKDDRNTGSVSEITLSTLVTFSNNLISFKHDACLASLRGQNFSLINQKAQIIYPKLCDLLNNQLIKRLKILMEASELYYSLDCENLSTCCKTLDQLSKEINESEMGVSSSFIGKDTFSQTDVKQHQNALLKNNNSQTQINNSHSVLTLNMLDSNIILTSEFDDNSKKKSFIDDNSKKKSFIEDKKKMIDKEISDMAIIIEQHVQSLKTIVESMNIIGETIKQLQEMFKKISHEIIPSDQVFNEENYSEIIENLELKKERIVKKVKEYDKDYLYIRNTFSPILSQLNEDSNTLLSLLKCYRSILILDHLTAMESTVIVTKNLERIKTRQPLMFEIKLYIFFFQFSLDNECKMDLIFTTYYENKKNMLLLNFKDNNEVISDKKDTIIIKDQILQIRFQDKHEKIIQKCLEDNYEMYYFALIFEKRKFLVSNSMTQTIEGYKKYCFDNLIFIDSDDDYGLITILHVNEAYYKTLLKDFRNSIAVSVSGKNSCTSREESKSSSLIYQNVFFSKYRCNKNCYLLQYKISNYISIIVKIKEKSCGTEIAYITEICKDFRNKFTEYHILKTIIPLKKIQTN